MDRHQFRADWHHYNDGIYFITICTTQKKHLFGEICDGTIYLSSIGDIVKNAILELPNHHNLRLLNYVVMPNHLHILIDLGNGLSPTLNNYRNIGCIRKPKHGDGCLNQHFQSALSIVVRTLKSYITHQIKKRNLYEGSIWQGRYHEHIIKSQNSLDQIWVYIDNNIANWDQDCFRW